MPSILVDNFFTPFNHFVAFPSFVSESTGREQQQVHDLTGDENALCDFDVVHARQTHPSFFIARILVRVEFVDADGRDAAGRDFPRPHRLGLVLNTADAAHHAVMVVQNAFSVAIRMTIMNFPAVFTQVNTIDFFDKRVFCTGKGRRWKISTSDAVRTIFLMNFNVQIHNFASIEIANVSQRPRAVYGRR